jgi:integrase
MSIGAGSARRRLTARRATKTEALDELDRMRLKLQAGIIPDNVTVGEWLQVWLKIRQDEYEAGELKWSALQANRGHVKTHLTPILGRIRLQDLAPEHVRQLKRALSRSGLAAQTQRNVHTTLRAALGRAMADRRITYNPAQVEKAPRRPKVTATSHRALPLELVTGMFAMCETPRELARITVGLTTGLRPGEIRGLLWSDVDLAQAAGVVSGSVRVAATLARVEGALVRTEPKTVSSVRTIPLLPMTAAALWQWRAESGGHGFIFHGHGGPDVPESPERDAQAWRAVTWRVGIDDFTPHGGRATAGSVLMSLHVPLPVIADILGHSQVSTTADWYTHSDEAQRLDAITQYGAALELGANT